jgi:ABC-type antimicrobial peptide transport system permease subunit
MLGTIGLAVVLVRTVIERKAELALLASLGFGRGNRITLVLSENVFLLVVGLVVGAACAVLGIVPTIYQSAQSINFKALGGTLLGVLCVGMISSFLAVWISGAHVTSADLRRE